MEWLFTDWSLADPRYFYCRGVMTGLVAAVVIWAVVVPLMKAYIHSHPRIYDK